MSVLGGGNFKSKGLEVNSGLSLVFREWWEVRLGRLRLGRVVYILLCFEVRFRRCFREVYLVFFVFGFCFLVGWRVFGWLWVFGCGD